MGEKVNAAKVASEEVEPGPTCQAVGRDLDIVDEFCFASFEFGHPALHQMGETIMRLRLDLIVNKNSLICQLECNF